MTILKMNIRLFIVVKQYIDIGATFCDLLGVQNRQKLIVLMKMPI